MNFNKKILLALMFGLLITGTVIAAYTQWTTISNVAITSSLIKLQVAVE